MVKAARLAEVPPGSAKLVAVGKRAIALFHLEGEIYAIDDSCPHRGGPLCEGETAGTTVTCPWHHALFDLRSGENLSGPPTRKLRRYETETKEGWIWVGEEIAPNL